MLSPKTPPVRGCEFDFDSQECVCSNSLPLFLTPAQDVVDAEADGGSSADRFYRSAHGNDPLAAGLFDLSVVVRELSAPAVTVRCQ